MSDEWLTSFQISRLIAEYRRALCYPGRIERFLWPKLAAGEIAMIASNATVKTSGQFGKTSLVADWKVPPACFDPEYRHAHLDLVDDSFTTRTGIRGIDRADCRFLRFERVSVLKAIGVSEESYIGPESEGLTEKRWRLLVGRAIREMDAEADELRQAAPQGGFKIKRMATLVQRAIDQIQDGPWRELVSGNPGQDDMRAAHAELCKLAGRGSGIVMTYAAKVDNPPGEAFAMAKQLAAEFGERVDLLFQDAIAGLGAVKSADEPLAPLDRNAPPAINSDKEAADAVAARQREVGGKVSTILRELYPSGSRNRSTESTHTAIRKSINYYYDKEGAPRKRD